jgi:hypothetical protein
MALPNMWGKNHIPQSTRSNSTRLHSIPFPPV